MKIENSIRQKIQKELSPQYLEIENESTKHRRPEGSETHFRLIVVSNDFEGLSRVDRQRRVANLFDDERDQGLHALSQRTFTPKEWEKAKETLTLQSPVCGHQMPPPKASKG